MISLIVNGLNNDVHMMRHSATACDPRHMADVTCCERVYSCEMLQRISVSVECSVGHPYESVVQEVAMVIMPAINATRENPKTSPLCRRLCVRA